MFSSILTNSEFNLDQIKALLIDQTWGSKLHDAWNDGDVECWPCFFFGSLH